MNYCPVNFCLVGFFVTDGQTDRCKAMHKSPQCIVHEHRWAQKPASNYFITFLLVFFLEFEPGQILSLYVHGPHVLQGTNIRISQKVSQNAGKSCNTYINPIIITISEPKSDRELAVL